MVPVPRVVVVVVVVVVAVAVLEESLGHRRPFPNNFFLHIFCI